jgi:hypothetical protein
MGCLWIKIPSLVIAASFSGLTSPDLLAGSPPLQAPPPLPPEILNSRPPAPPPDLPDPSELIAQLKQLEELLSLGPEKLRKLRQTIEFIEKMSDAEREAMRIRLTQVTQMTDELRQEIDAMAGLVPMVRKSDLSQFWLAASEDERAAIREDLAGIPPSEQSQLLISNVSGFVEKRDEVFRQMKESLEQKRSRLENPKN